MSMVGILHKSIEIFTVLMSDPPVAMEPSEMWSIEQVQTRFRSRDTSNQARHVSLVKDVVEKLGSLADKCRSFFTFTARDTEWLHASAFSHSEGSTARSLSIQRLFSSHGPKTRHWNY